MKQIKETDTLKLTLLSNCGNTFENIKDYELMSEIVNKLSHFDLTPIDEILDFYYNYHFEESKKVKNY